jgi:phosphomannomutase
MTVGNYIPERDGVWTGLCVWDIIVESGKKLSELVQEVYAITGSFAYERLDLELNKNVRNKLIDKCMKDQFSEFGEYKIQKSESLDGYRYIINESDWILIRASGSGPIIRIYVEATDRDNVIALMNAVVNTVNLV